jgi:hypothetical protein
MEPNSRWNRFKIWLCDLKASDVMMVLLTLVIAGTGVVGIILVIQGGEDTKRIIKASEDQACAAQKIADASKRNAAAAESFSNTAREINTGISEAVGNLNLQAKALSDAAKAAVKQAADSDKLVAAADTANNNATRAIESQTRPWVGVAEVPTVENGSIVVVLKNYGNSPAIVVGPPPMFTIHRLGKPEFRYWKVDIPGLCGFEVIPQEKIDETKPRNVFAIFPGETKKIPVRPFIQDDPFNSYLSGCIVYNVSATGYYMTRVIYDLSYVDEHQNKLASPKIQLDQTETLEWKRGTPKPD